MRLLFILALPLFAACGSTPPARPTSATEPVETPAPSSAEQPVAAPAPAPAPGERPTLTAAACEAQGGKVVGDIGDGAVHRPDYRCESGAPPVGTVVADSGGPRGIEGAVCCK